MVNSKISSIRPLQAQNPAALEARRDLSVLLKEVREKSGLTKSDLARKSGISVSCISSFDDGAKCPRSKYLSAYDIAALSVDISPLDIFRAYEKAKDLEQGYLAAESYFMARKHSSEIADDATEKSTLFEVWENGSMLNWAALNPKALLESARWLPQRAEDRMERVVFYKSYIGKVDGIKEYCISLATEAQQMLTTYKEIGKLFDTYAADLPGYRLVKKQFYYGKTLDDVLKTEVYTRRWAQTLQERTLKIFQQRAKEQYDKRRIGA